MESRASFFSGDEPVELADATPLDGMLLSGDTAEYLDRRLVHAGVIGGSYRLECRKRSILGSATPRVVIDYLTPRPLTEEELALLIENTEGQISDGTGENGFEIDGPDTPLTVFAEPAVNAVQLDDPTPVPDPSRVAIAASEGRLDDVRRGLEASEDVDAFLGGCTALHLAILCGYPDIAILLIQGGANPSLPDSQGSVPLDLCAAARSLSDVDARRVADELVRAGAKFASSQAARETLDLARGRNKVELAHLLERVVAQHET